MKKIITLLVSVTMVASVFAQFGNRDQRDNGSNGYDKGKDVVYNDGWKDGKGYGKDFYYFSAKEKDMQIAQINREFDRKVESVKHKFFMPRFKKEQAISQLECDRTDQIKAVLMKFNSRMNLYNGGPKKHW